MTLPVIDYAALTDAEVSSLKESASLEEQRRARVANAPAQADALAASYLEAVGRAKDSNWIQPNGAHDCYPQGYTVVHKEKLWKSLVHANVWAPGSNPTLWEDQTVPIDPPIGENEAWDPNAHSYLVNDVVAFDDNTYVCLQAHTSQAGWTPAAVPALWELVNP